jgi:osmoprotectant transport system permease protein
VQEQRAVVEFVEYLMGSQGRLLGYTLEHVSIVLQAIVLATLIGVPAGIMAQHVPAVRPPILNFASAILTVPSLALFALFIPVMGIGDPPTIAALTLYALLPIVRNTMVGVAAVDQAIVESARGMGLNARQRLLKIELPLAWPVILTGLRVSTQLVIGIAAIAALVGGNGLGQEIFRGIRTIGGAGYLERILAGTLLVALLALIFDLLYQGVGRLTTSKGIR